MAKEKLDWCKQQGKRMLLVEGKNDCHVILALWQAHKSPPKGCFGIYQCDNDEGVLKKLNELIQGAIAQTNELEIVGIVLDADKPDVKARWQQIQAKLKRYAYSFPEQPEPQGTIILSLDEKPRLGIWLMPNNQDAGMLEDFLMGLAQPDSLNLARHCVEQARQQNLASVKEVHHSKAIIHTYLAWQDEPGNPLGQAITAHALQPHTDIAQLFTHWLNRLFNNEAGVKGEIGKGKGERCSQKR
jgi:hypothetical protein